MTKVDSRLNIAGSAVHTISSSVNNLEFDDGITIKAEAIEESLGTKDIGERLRQLELKVWQMEKRCEKCREDRDGSSQ